MAKSDSNRDGKRKSVGRPHVSPDLIKVGIYLKLPQWLLNWLADQAEQKIGSRAELIEKALRKTYKISPPANPAPPPDTAPAPKKSRR